MKLKTGQYVRHSRYGWGTILERDRDQTMVYFQRAGLKRLVASPTTFAVVQDQAFKKTPSR
jgi:hypothetical protein